MAIFDFGPITVLDQLRKDAYRPASIVLNPILPLLRSRDAVLLDTRYNNVRFSCILPGGQLYYDSQLAADDDGSPAFTSDPTKKGPSFEKKGIYYDNAHQADIAWTPGGKSLDANAVPFFSLPMGFSHNPKYDRHFGTRVGKGDLAAVIYKNVVAFAVLADFGGKPKNGKQPNMGEGSIELHRLLGHECIRTGYYSAHPSIPHYFDAGIARDVVTIVFPGTGNNSVCTRESIEAAAKPLYIKLILSGLSRVAKPLVSAAERGLAGVRRLF